MLTSAGTSNAERALLFRYSSRAYSPSRGRRTRTRLGYPWTIGSGSRAVTVSPRDRPGPRSPRAFIARRDQELRDRVLDVLLDRAAQGPRAHVRVVSALREQPLDRGVVHVDEGALGRDRRVDVVDEQAADPARAPSRPSGWNTIVSSIRLMNSGEKSFLSSFRTMSSISRVFWISLRAAESQPRRG